MGAKFPTYRRLIELRSRNKVYVDQGTDCTCQIATLLNYCIENGLEERVQYNSRKFWQLAKKCGSDRNNPVADIRPVTEFLQLKLLSIPAFRLMPRFEKYLRTSLKNGLMFSFRYWPPADEMGHNFLITHYDPQSKLFRTIDSGLGKGQLVEWLSFKLLMQNCYRPEFGIYNVEEGTYYGANNTVTNTKAIIPVSQ